jgi:hypothetical protein
MKVTFTLDEATVTRLRQASLLRRNSQSDVVREAICSYYPPGGKLTERERAKMLRTLDEGLPKIPTRSAADAAAELGELRRARHAPR